MSKPIQPDLELVQIGRAESFKAWEHGYPYHTVRWHFHPEFELHHVVETSGHYFVGDFIGDFRPGNLVLTGPNLPHNWISDVPPGTEIPLRGRVLQFSEQFIRSLTGILPELSSSLAVLELSRRGALFTPETGARVGSILGELIEAKGIRRIELFMAIMGILSGDGARPLTGVDYIPDPSGFMSTGINEVLAYINLNLNEPFGERDLAAIAGLSPGAFSRSFRRHTGMALCQYVNRLRINFASQLLMSEAGISITDACYASGFGNISNFNRQFLRQKGMPPSRFLSLMAENTGKNGPLEKMKDSLAAPDPFHQTSLQSPSVDVDLAAR